jgi:hypothetical protein
MLRIGNSGERGGRGGSKAQRPPRKTRQHATTPAIDLLLKSVLNQHANETIAKPNIR